MTEPRQLLELRNALIETAKVRPLSELEEYRLSELVKKCLEMQDD